MNIKITGRHIEVGDALRNHCAEALKSVSNYFPEMVNAEIVFSTRGHHNYADVKIHASQVHLRAQADAEDFYLSIDGAVEKVLRQLDKYKGRLQKHRRRRDNDKFSQAEEIRATHNTIVEAELEAAPENDTYAPNVERKEMKNIQVLTVDEAVMQMDLMHTNIFLFFNIHTNAINVVYREDEGSIGWVETDKVERVAKAS